MQPTQHQRPFEISRDLYPFDDHWFVHQGTALHYIDHGEGLPVVFCHGNPTWSFLYRDVIGALDGQVRALAMDLPGFGMSQAPPNFGYQPHDHAAWLGAWIDALNLPKFVLVVQDWGGPTGLRMAAERADQVAGLVIMNTWCWPAGFKMRMMSRVLGSGWSRRRQRRQGYFTRTLIPGGMVTADTKSPDVLEAYNKPLEPAERRDAAPMFADAIRTSRDWLQETGDMLHRLQGVPVEMVWGMKDMGLGNEETIARWLAHFPDARVTRLAHASHYVQEDEPVAIAEAVTRVVANVHKEKTP